MANESKDDSKLTASILIRLTPETKAELEDAVWLDRTTIPELVRDRIKRFILSSKNRHQ